jgi:hypothetical protein
MIFIQISATCLVFHMPVTLTLLSLVSQRRILPVWRSRRLMGRWRSVTTRMMITRKVAFTPSPSPLPPPWFCWDRYLLQSSFPASLSAIPYIGMTCIAPSLSMPSRPPSFRNSLVSSPEHASHLEMGGAHRWRMWKLIQHPLSQWNRAKGSQRFYFVRFDCLLLIWE